MRLNHRSCRTNGVKIPDSVMFHGPFSVVHYAYTNVGYWTLNGGMYSVEGGAERNMKRDIDKNQSYWPMSGAQACSASTAMGEPLAPHGSPTTQESGVDSQEQVGDNSSSSPLLHLSAKILTLESVTCRKRDHFFIPHAITKSVLTIFFMFNSLEYTATSIFPYLCL